MIRNKKSLMFIPAVLTTLFHAVTWFFIGIVTTVFLFLVNVFMPPRGKRWLVLASLYFTLNPTREETAIDELKYFNNEMDLVDDFNALKVAYYVRNKIWSPQVFKECVDEVDAYHGVEREQKLAEALINHVMPQMLYGRRSDLERDFKAILHLNPHHGELV